MDAPQKQSHREGGFVGSFKGRSELGRQVEGEATAFGVIHHRVGVAVDEAGALSTQRWILVEYVVDGNARSDVLAHGVRSSEVKVVTCSQS